MASRDHLYKSRIITKNDRETRKLSLKTHRNQKRQEVVFAGRNIKMEDIFASSDNLSNIVADKPVPIAKKDQMKHVLNENRKNKNHNQNEKPPFITVVPIGKYIEPPSNSALEKRIFKTNQKLENQKMKQDLAKNKLTDAKKRQNTKELNRMPQTNQFLFSNMNVEHKIPLASASLNKDANKQVKEKPYEIKLEKITGLNKTNNEDSLDNTIHDSNLNETFDEVSHEKIIDENILDKTGNEVVFDKTISVHSSPNDELNKSNRYLSPFVSVSRGKGSIKRETKKRDSVYKIHTPDDKSELLKKNQEAAFYFENCLNDEIIRLNKIADDWEIYKTENIELLDDTQDMIDVAIGQTRLLIKNKFEQFRTIIDQCRNNSGLKEIFPQDLEGFWTMLNLQVENLDERFNKLKQFKNNNWIDPDLVSIEPTKPNKRRGKKNNPKTKSKKSVSPRTEIKNFMKNFKLKKMQQAKETITEEPNENPDTNNVEFHLRT